MISLTWDYKFSVGVDAIDEQHKQLFNILGDLRKAIIAGQTGQYILNLIQKLDDYASMHFSLEEKYMEENHYPNFLEHKAQHQAFINEVNNFRANLDTNEINSSLTLLEFLIKWITFHILESDKEYAYYIKK